MSAEPPGAGGAGWPRWIDSLALAAFAIGVHVPFLLGRPFFFGDDFGWLADIDNLSQGTSSFFTLSSWGVWRLGYRAFLWIEYQAFGLRPFPYYLVNVALHALATVTLAGVARSLGASRGRAVLAGALFAAWSAPSLTVRYSTASMVELAAVATLLGLAAQRASRPWVAAGLTFAGATVYEQTLAAVPAMVTANFSTRRRPLTGVLPAAGAAVVFVVGTLWTLRGTTKILAYNPGGLDAVRQAILVPLLVAAPGTPLTRGWMGAAPLAVLLALALLWRPGRAALPGLLLSWSAVLPLLGRDQVWPEWYLYLPSAGVALALASAAPCSRAWSVLCLAVVAWNLTQLEPQAEPFLRYTRRYQQVTVGTPPRPDVRYVVLANIHSGLAWTAWQFGGSVQSFELWASSRDAAGCFTGASLEEARGAMRREFPDATRRLTWPDDMPLAMRGARAPARHRLFAWPEDGRVPP